MTRVGLITEEAGITVTDQSVGGRPMTRTPRGLKQFPEAGCSFSEMKAE